MASIPARTAILKYAEPVDVSITPENTVNFADDSNYGHRVQISVALGAVDSFLRWSRDAGSDRPVGAAVSGGETAFKAALVTALNASYADVDGVAGGLHFGSATMTTAAGEDSRIRKNGVVSANDIPMAFVLWKLYGASDVATKDLIYNLADAYDMVTSEAVADAIAASFLEHNGMDGAVDRMFRDLLAAEPARFFDAQGNQLPGLFEVAVDSRGDGGWQLIVDDILEVRLKLKFTNPVTRRGVGGGEHDLTGSAGANPNEQVVIAANDYFFIRLQIKIAASA